MKTKRFRNAGITTKREAIDRLLAGEVFFYNKNYESAKIHADLSSQSIFLWNDTPIRGGWDLIEDWQKEVDSWVDVVSPENPILCKVWDSDGEGVALVTGVNTHGNYITSDKLFWNNAEPVTEEEIKEYLW